MTIELSARYFLQSEERATVLIEGDLLLRGLEDDLEAEEAQSELLLTLLHERVGLPPSQMDWRGYFKHQCEVANGESLTLIARRAGRIVACQVSEVNTSPASRLLLHPKGGFHLLIHQQRCSDLEEVQVMAAIDQAVVAHILQQIQL